MSLFSDINPDDPIPPLEAYTSFLADQGSTLLLIALTRASYYQALCFQLQEEALQAERLGETNRSEALLNASGEAWDQCATHAQEARFLLLVYQN
jgi:hypothetical protein